MNYMLLADLPLGLNLLEVLINMLNLVILIVGMRFILYKPIKKFMDKRKAQYQAVEDDANAKIETAEKLKAQYENLVENANNEATQITQQATDSAQNAADEIMEEAKAEAKAMLEKTTQDIAQSKMNAKDELSNEISTLAIDMASRILEREVSQKDNDAFIDSLLKEWKNK